MRLAILAVWLLVAAPAVAASPFFETSTPAPGFLARSAPEAVGLEARRLEGFVDRARLADSDALVVLKDGKVVVERYFGQPAGPLPCMSITKAVASLAIGKLMDEGRIRSLDETAATWLPEWKQDPTKARITLRQLMTHTSGLPGLNGSELYPHEDMLAFARGLAVRHEPGTHWEYSNPGAMLLAGIVRQASGKPLDRYLQDKVFEPLGIMDWTWHRDKAGNPDAFGGLQLRPRDLAKIGQLMLDQGRWQGRQILSVRFVTEATAPSQQRHAHQGLVWALHYPDGYLLQTDAGLEALRRAGFEAADKLAPLTGRRFPFGTGYLNAVKERLSEGEYAQLRALMRREVGPVSVQYGRRFFGHDGWLGQFLVVDPTTRLVAVRMIRHKQEVQEPTFPDFYEWFGRLTGA